MASPRKMFVVTVSLLMGFLCFLPLALILAEFASDTTEGGGIYSFMERGLGSTWAFVGTWSYFGAGLYALQADPVDWIYVGVVYGGPLMLIGLGMLLREWSLRAHHVRGSLDP